jgi:hypothetical protein
MVTFPAASPGSPPEAADVGARRAVAAVALQWGAGIRGQRAEDGGRKDAAPDKQQKESAACCWNGSKTPGPMDFDSFLEYASNRSFSISAMAFQDVWNLDLERLRDCCIHVVSEDGRLIPFCAYNLTDSNNQPLYRGRK